MIGAILLAAPKIKGAAAQSGYLLDLWTSDNGLPDNSVSSILQTPDGYLWIGTENGLTRYDGVRFVTFDPANTPQFAHARVSALFTDVRGTLWINTYDGSLTSMRNGVFTHEWSGGQVTAVFSRSNQTFFATLSSGVAVRTEIATNQVEWQTINLARRNDASAFCQDAGGVIWYMLRDGKFGRIVGTNAVLLSGDTNLGDEQINCLTTDHRGGIWVGTRSKIARWDGNHFQDETPTNGEAAINVKHLFFTTTNGFWAFVNGTIRHAVNRQWVATVDAWPDLFRSFVIDVGAFEAQNGDVWFRQLGHGLFHADTEGKIERISAKNGLPGDRVTSWFQDREGSIWVGIDRGGLVRLRDKKFQLVGGSEGQQNAAAATVCEDADNNIWIGTIGGGLIRWRDGQQEKFNLLHGANRDSFYSAYPDAQRRLWLSADREDLYSLATNQIIRDTNGIHGIKTILADHQNRLWLGRLSGLTCITNGVVLNYGPWNGFDRREVRALAEDARGAIWIGTDNGMIYRFSNGTFTAFKPEDARADQSVWSLLPEADGTIWAGTFRGGLLRFKDGKFTRYTTADGLPSDIICQILDDGLGRLWFGSHKGIFFLPKNSFDAFDRRQLDSLPCTTYNLSDGLPTLECSGGYQPSCWRNHEGRFLFATLKGAVAINPEEVRLNQLKPPVVIEDFLLDGTHLKNAGKVETQKSEALPPAAGLARGSTISISPGRHQFDFQFTALSFIAPDKVRFRYQLTGFDNDWVEAGAKRAAHYGPLQPGNYKFQVIACNNDGVWNEQGASINLIQRPFFWQTWWFDVLAVVAAILAVSVAARHLATRKLQKKLEQLKQQHAIECERERIAKDIHDDLGAGLTQILLQSSLARRVAEGQTKTDLTQISETARNLVRTMDEIVWAITPENDTLDSMVSYFGKFVQEFSSAAQLRCRLDLPTQPPAITVSAETRHHLFLAIKESLNNVVKHSRATEVLFQLKLQPAAFTFVINDNGVGFVTGASDESLLNPERLSSGHGLHNLVKRLKEIGGSCSITGEPGQGTRIELSIPTGNHRSLP